MFFMGASSSYHTFYRRSRILKAPREAPLRGGVSVILCDLRGEQKECVQKEIDGREFHICAKCWRPLEETGGDRGAGFVRMPMIF